MFHCDIWRRSGERRDICPLTGLGSNAQAFPALKGWAKLCRPCGACSSGTASLGCIPTIDSSRQTEARYSSAPPGRSRSRLDSIRQKGARSQHRGLVQQFAFGKARGTERLDVADDICLAMKDEVGQDLPG